MSEPVTSPCSPDNLSKNVKSIKWILVAIAVAAVAWILYKSFSKKTTEKLEISDEEIQNAVNDKQAKALLRQKMCSNITDPKKRLECRIQLNKKLREASTPKPQEGE